MLQHYQKRQAELPDVLERMEKQGCPHTEQSYTLYRDMHDNNLPPFGKWDTGAWEAWIADDMLYFALAEEFSNLPYRIRDIQKSIDTARNKK